MAEEIMMEEVEQPEDDQLEDVPLEEDEPVELPLVWDQEDPNLAVMLSQSDAGRRKALEIVDLISEYFEQCRLSGEQHRDKEARNWKLFCGDLPPKDYPWDGCANMHVPVMLENLSRLTLRTMGEIIGGKQMMAVVPVGPDDADIADIMTAHDNWQLLNEIGDFRRQLFRSLLCYYTHGDTSWESSYDETKQENRNEALTSDDLYVPYTFVSTQADLSDCPHYFRVRRLYRNDLQARRASWVGVDRVLRGGPSEHDDDEPGTPLADASAETHELEKPDIVGPYSGTHTIIQFEGWLTLDEADRDRWCRAIYDKETETLLELRIHEEPSWKEMERFSYQERELEAWKQAMQQYEQQVQGMQQQVQQLEMLVSQGQADPMMLQQMQGQMGMIPPPPPPPQWVDIEAGITAPPPMELSPIRTFTHGVCIENLTGFLGISFGRNQGDLNRLANTAMNQFIDAASLANGNQFLLAGGIEFEDDTPVYPGARIKLTGMIGGDISKSIMPLKHDGANPQLKDVAQMAMQLAQSSVQAQDVLSGAPGKSGETFRGLSARIEQATKQLSVSAQMFCQVVMTGVLRQNARLNSIYLDESQVKWLLNHKLGNFQSMTVDRAMWRRNYQVVFSGDMRFVTTAVKVSEADEVAQMPGMIAQQLGPAAAMVNLQAMVWDGAVGSLKARGREDLVRTLGPRPPDPQFPFGIMPMPQMMPGAPPGAPGAPPGGGQGQPPPQGIPGPKTGAQQ